MSEGDAMVDAELVLKFQGGEESAFETLVRKYMKDAYSFCLRLTHDAQEAEELSQMGFVNAYRALRGFRGESSFKSWLYRIFINQYRDRLRRTRRPRRAWWWSGRRRAKQSPTAENLSMPELEEVGRPDRRLPDRQCRS